MGLAPQAADPSGGEHESTVEWRARGRLRDRTSHAREHSGGPRSRTSSAARRRRSLFGHKFWFLANFQTAAEPLQRREHARHQLRHRVLGQHRLRRRLRRVPDLRHLAADAEARSRTCAATGRRATRRCSTATATAPPTRSCCRSTPAGRPAVRRRSLASKERDDRKYPHGTWEGIRMFDVTNPYAAGAGGDGLPGLRLAHEHAAARAEQGPRRHAARRSRCTCSTRATRSARARRAARLGEAAGRKVNHGVVQVVEIPGSDDPSTGEGAHRSYRSCIRTTRTASTSRSPTTRHRRAAGQLPRLPRPEHVPRAGDRRRGVRRAGAGAEDRSSARGCRTRPTRSGPTTSPTSTSGTRATFSWDGKVANFIDESFGDGRPTVTTKTAGLPGPPKDYESGNSCSSSRPRAGELLSEYRNPRPTNDTTSPTTGKYCSSHLDPGAVVRPVPARQRVLPRWLVGDRLQRPENPRRSPSPTRTARTPGPRTRTRAKRLVEVDQRVLQRRPEPQLRGARPTGDLPGGRVRPCASARRSGAWG